MPISSSRARLHLVVEVARRHLARALREHLDGLGDAAGEVEAEPGGGEHDDQGHQEEEQDVDALDGVLQELELLVLLEGLADPAQPVLQPLGDMDGDHEAPDDLAVEVAHGDHRLDHVAALELLDGGDLLPGEPLRDLALGDGARADAADRGILHVQDLVCPSGRRG